MRNWLPLIVVVSWLSPLAADSARGQWVGVYRGGGTVIRAPFVRVEVSRSGGTYVRAPFTSVYAPGLARRGFYGPPGSFYPAPARAFRTPIPALQDRQIVQNKDVRDMDYRELRETLRSRLSKLESQLLQRQDGAAWSRYLQPGAMRDLVASVANEPADEPTNLRLRQMLEEFDGTAADATSQAVANLSGFREVHAALAEFLRPPTERERDLLVVDATALSNSLSRFKTGKGWQRYLLLIDPSSAAGPKTAAEWSDAQIVQQFDRFESVRGNLEFDVISGLPSFQAMHDRLASYVGQLDGQPGEVESLPPAEELPSPEG